MNPLHLPSQGQGHNRRWRYQQPQSPSFPSPSSRLWLSKAIEAQYPWHLQYHPGQIARMDLDILDEAGGIEKKHI